MYVFVYGTLKKHYLGNLYLEDATFIGEGATYDRFHMYESVFPMIEEDNSSDDAFPISGEIYKIDADILSVLDEYESYPQLYSRKVVMVSCDDGGDYDCLIYIPNKIPDDLKHELYRSEPIDGCYQW